MTRDVVSRWGRLVVAAIPVVLVNAVAFTGQLAFLRAHLPWGLAGQVLMALALESVAIYLAFQAHVAQLANDSALRLRLAAYGFALIIAACNYSHYADHWRPTFPAVAVGLMSALSPWLWATHSRRVSRDALLAAGLVEPHALRLGTTRWLWHPLRSARVMFHATWGGVSDPRAAIAAWEARRRSAPGVHPPTALALNGQVHLGGAPAPALESAPGPHPAGAPGSGSRAHSGRTRNGTRQRTQGATDTDAEVHFAADLAAGELPPVRRIQRELHVGQERARALRKHLENLVTSSVKEE